MVASYLDADSAAIGIHLLKFNDAARGDVQLLEFVHQ